MTANSNYSDTKRSSRSSPVFCWEQEQVTPVRHSAPYVTGVVALLQSQHPDWTYTQVIDRIVATVDPCSFAARKNRKWRSTERCRRTGHNVDSCERSEHCRR